jgi:hypothetical protein
MSVESELAQAKKLIQAKQYDDAIALLITIDHPTADKWLAKLNSLSSRQVATSKPKTMPEQNKQTPAAKSQDKQPKKSNLLRNILLTIVGGLILCTGIGELAYPSKPTVTRQPRATLTANEKVISAVHEGVPGDVDVHTVDIDSDTIAVTFRIESYLFDSTLISNVTHTICELRAIGFDSHNYEIVEEVSGTNAYGESVWITAIETELSQNAIQRLNCENSSSIRLSVVADYYYLHPDLR